MYYEQKILKRAHFNNSTWLITLIVVKPRAHNERTFAQTSAHLRKRAHISEVPISTFVCHNSARAENCKTYTFHAHERKFKRAEKSVLFKIQEYIVTLLGDHNSVTKPSASLHETGLFSSAATKGWA